MAYSVLATTSFPVPGSPVMRTLASDGPHARNHLQHGLHGRRFGDERWHAFGAQQPVLGLQTQAAADGVAQIDLCLDDAEQAFVFPGLLDKIARPAAHGFHSQADGAPGGHYDDRQNGIDGLNPREQVQAFLAGSGIARVIQIHQYDIEVARLERGDDAGRRSGGFDLVALAFEQQAEGFEYVSLVVRDKDARG